MTSPKKNVIGYSVIFAMVGQFVNIALMGIWVSIASLATPFERAMAAQNNDQSLFEKVQSKYKTDDPQNNRGDDKLLNDTLNKYHNTGSSNTSKENEIIQKYYVNPQPSKTVDLSKYGNYGENAEQRIEASISTARAISSNVALPTSTSGGGIATRYSKEGVELKKENGNYTATLDQSKVTSSSMAQDEFTSSELTHTETSFNADQHYGDETQFYAGGQNRIGVLKNGKSSDSTAYQTIQGIRATNMPPEINPDSSLFNFGNKEVNDAIDGKGNWLSSCTDTTTPTSRDFTSTTSQTHLCMKPQDTNPLFCEVERIYNVPHAIQSVSGNVAVAACGEACVEITFNPGMGEDDFYLSDSCTVFSENAVVELNPNLQIDTVEVIDSTFDDHGIIKVNGTAAWSVIDGVYGSSGTFSNSCELKTDWVNSSHQGNMSNVIKDEFISNNGVFNLSMLTKVGGGGNGYFQFRVHLSDPDGEPFGLSYKQFPEGCYDAVAPEIRAKNGLVGLGEVLENGVIGDNSQVGVVGGGSGGSGGTREVEYTCIYEPELGQMLCDGLGSNKGYGAGWCEAYPGLSNHFKCTATVSGTGSGTGSGGESEFPYSFCRFDSYTNLAEGDGNLPPALFDSVPQWYEGDTGNKTWRVNLDGFRCDPTGGYDYCVTTKKATEEEKAQGIEDEVECYTWEDIKNQPNHCEIYETDSSCTLQSTTCAEGWGWTNPDTGDPFCFASTVEYQCDEEITTTVVSERTTNSCAATLPCIGGNCETANIESNDQFAEALAMASVVQHMEDGMSCEDPSDPSTCTIFEGEGKFCSWEPTGLGNDCCEAPDGIDIFEYAKAAYAMLQADAYVAGIEGTSNAVVGGYQELRQPIADAATSAGEAASDAWNAVSSLFTDEASSLAGTAGGQVTSESGTVMSIFSDEAMEQMQQAVMRYLHEALPDALADALFQELGAEAGEQAGQMALSDSASQAASVLGAIYGAYVVYQYIKLAINLLSACHEYEMDMGVRIATKQCIPVGEKYCAKDALGICYIRRQDHCCYDSILARIIMEQASPMLGHDLGAHTGEFIDGSDIRSCPGLTPDQLAQLDWNKIDLSEWISIMLESGITSYDQDVDKLTGSGRTINNYGREDAITRNKDKVNNTNLADRARESKRLLKDDKVDCSYNPRPFSCYFNNEGGN